jgi:hypothetical protein
MINLDMLSVGVSLGALISFAVITFALTTDVLREYLLADALRTNSAQRDRTEDSTQEREQAPVSRL